MRFRDRTDAGRLLADALAAYKDDDVVIYALPRGGVTLGAIVANRLHAPLDLAIPRKVSHPDNPEYAVCAITEAGHLVCTKEDTASIDPGRLTIEVQKEQIEAKRRRERYTAGRPTIYVKGKTAIVVDDGIATGLTMVAAIQEVRDRLPDKVVVAAPVAPDDVAKHLERYVDDMVILHTPKTYPGAVSAYYDNFEEITDDEVIALLATA